MLEGHDPIAKVTDVEVSAFSKCFLLIDSFFLSTADGIVSLQEFIDYNKQDHWPGHYQPCEAALRLEFEYFDTENYTQPADDNYSTADARFFIAAMDFDGKSVTL